LIKLNNSDGYYYFAYCPELDGRWEWGNGGMGKMVGEREIVGIENES
jgi:hypothetical protein